jgi:dolichol-phosphate mannosyltransferase
MKKLSVVIPVCSEEETLAEAVPSLLALASRLPGWSLELVFVDDGSQDRSLAMLLDFQRAQPGKLVVVKLTRNFGSMAAIQAGFSQATGDCVGVIAADLQDPPELLLEMVRHWEQGVKAVFAVRSARHDSSARRLTSALYYRLLRRFALPGYPKGGFDLMLLDRRIVEQINRIEEKNANLMSLVFWLGYPHVLIPYVRRSRRRGRSKWSTSKKIKFFIDTFVAFSHAPIRLAWLAGLVLTGGALGYGGLALYRAIAVGAEIGGLTALLIFFALVSGVQMILLGVLGEYLWRTLEEARGRPAYVIDEVHKD